MSLFDPVQKVDLYQKGFDLIYEKNLEVIKSKNKDWCLSFVGLKMLNFYDSGQDCILSKFYSSILINNFLIESNDELEVHLILINKKDQRELDENYLVGQAKYKEEEKSFSRLINTEYSKLMIAVQEKNLAFFLSKNNWLLI